MSNLSDIARKYGFSILNSASSVQNQTLSASDQEVLTQFRISSANYIRQITMQMLVFVYRQAIIPNNLTDGLSEIFKWHDYWILT